MQNQNENILDINSQELPSASGFRARHFGLFLSFCVIFLSPTVAVYLYLENIALPRYSSYVGFTVHKEDSSYPDSIVAGISSIGGQQVNDSDILFEYIYSQEIVEKVDELVGLRANFHTDGADPFFELKDDSSTEDLVEYWRRIVTQSYDAGTGLIEVRALSFDPVIARKITTEILRVSSEMINELSAIAQDDITKAAKANLNGALERLVDARKEIASFRVRNQIVDLGVDLDGQMGLVRTLQNLLADLLVEHDVLKNSVGSNDPRISELKLKIAVLRKRIDAERKKIVNDVPTGQTDYASLINEYEELKVNLEYSQQAYISAISTLDSAMATARTKRRYLAPYIKPTLPDRPTHPDILTTTSLTGLFSFLLWSIIIIIWYGIRDRRM